MGRRRKPRFLSNGVLVVDKPEGPTSHDVVARLRQRFAPAKLGHAGTLDPFASGVLVLAFNQATRLLELFGSGRKVYRGVIALGEATDTGDPTGQVVRSAPVPELARGRVEEVLASLVGTRMQVPPAYSAAKHQGRPLYAWARQGVAVQKPPRRINIARAELLDLGPGSIEVEIECSRGTYVRALAEDIAAALDTEGHLSSLRRTASLPFVADQALGLDEAAGLSDTGLEEALIDASEALARCGLAAVDLDDDSAWRLRQGQVLDARIFAAAAAGEPEGAAFRALGPEGELVAVLRWLGPGKRRPGRDYETIRVFPERNERRGGETSASALGGAE